MNEHEAKIDELQKRVRTLELEKQELVTEIDDCHSILDGARIGMPEDFDTLTDKEKVRSMKLPGRLVQGLLAWSNPVLANRV